MERLRGELVVDGYIDQVGATGIVKGWARSDEHFEPVEVTLWLEGKPAGAATASAFRRDLLAAGVGHGHYGFQCTINTSESPHGVLELREAGGDVAIATHIIEPDSLTPNHVTKRTTIESILVKPDRWTIEDIATYPQALQLETRFRELGPRRYIAMVYWFLLGRWPGEHEYDFFLPHLRRDIITATDIFLTTLNSDELKEKGLQPMSPFDPHYPFRGRRGQFVPPAPPAAQARTRDLAATPPAGITLDPPPGPQ